MDSCPLFLFKRIFKPKLMLPTSLMSSPSAKKVGANQSMCSDDVLYLLYLYITFCISTSCYAHHYHIPVSTYFFCLSPVGQREQNRRHNPKIGINRQVNICAVFNQNLRRCKLNEYTTLDTAFKNTFRRHYILKQMKETHLCKTISNILCKSISYNCFW